MNTAYEGQLKSTNRAPGAPGAHPPSLGCGPQRDRSSGAAERPAVGRLAPPARKTSYRCRLTGLSPVLNRGKLALATRRSQAVSTGLHRRAHTTAPAFKKTKIRKGRKGSDDIKMPRHKNKRDTGARNYAVTWHKYPS